MWTEHAFLLFLLSLKLLSFPSDRILDGMNSAKTTNHENRQTALCFFVFSFSCFVIFVLFIPFKIYQLSQSSSSVKSTCVGMFPRLTLCASLTVRLNGHWLGGGINLPCASVAGYGYGFYLFRLCCSCLSSSQEPCCSCGPGFSCIVISGSSLGCGSSCGSYLCSDVILCPSVVRSWQCLIFNLVLCLFPFLVNALFPCTALVACSLVLRLARRHR